MIFFLVGVAMVPLFKYCSAAEEQVEEGWKLSDNSDPSIHAVHANTK